jgi:hypothetical protein
MDPWSGSAWEWTKLSNRERMEASENPGSPPEGSGAPALHRIDRNRVDRLLREGARTPGFQRLALMVGTIMPRLEAPRG